MCVPRLSIVDSVHTKTQILLATSRTRNQSREESYVFSKPNICPHQVDVEEATNVSIPQFSRVRNHFVGCWTVHGWLSCTCCRFMGGGDRSVAFDKQHQITQHLETDVKKTVHEITNPNPNKRETEKLSNCRMWTTFLQTHILLKASLSCTSLKTMKQ